MATETKSAEEKAKEANAEAIKRKPSLMKRWAWPIGFLLAGGMALAIFTSLIPVAGPFIAAGFVGLSVTMTAFYAVLAIGAAFILPSLLLGLQTLIKEGVTTGRVFLGLLVAAGVFCALFFGAPALGLSFLGAGSVMSILSAVGAAFTAFRLVLGKDLVKTALENKGRVLEGVLGVGAVVAAGLALVGLIPLALSPAVLLPLAAGIIILGASMMGGLFSTMNAWRQAKTAEKAEIEMTNVAADKPGAVPMPSDTNKFAPPKPGNEAAADKTAGASHPSKAAADAAAAAAAAGGNNPVPPAA